MPDATVVPGENCRAGNTCPTYVYYYVYYVYVTPLVCRSAVRIRTIPRASGPVEGALHRGTVPDAFPRGECSNGGKIFL
jgi:hypothetical protein